MSDTRYGHVECRENCGCYAIDRDTGNPFTVFHCAKHAAAPALLEALEKLVAECGSLQIAAVREGLGNTNAAVLNLRAQEARAAIAQAKGETANG